MKWKIFFDNGTLDQMISDGFVELDKIAFIYDV